jgi:uncharacterized membrane protein
MAIMFLKMLKDRVRRYFFAGLLIILPLGITLYVITTLLRMMDHVLDIIPLPLHPQTYLPFPVPGLGLILSLIVVILTGMLAKNYIGRRVVDFGEYLLSKIPLVRPIYSAMKQITQAMFGETQAAFKQAVLVEFPRQGVYALGFVTGTAMAEIDDRTARKLVSIFLPTTPNPTSGFYLMVPEKETIPLGMSVEDAFKLLISAGIAAPGNHYPHLQSGKGPAHGQLGQPARREGGGSRS